jgi:membrane associated rhomboid family serine protease
MSGSTPLITLEPKESAGSIKLPKWTEIPKYPVIAALSVLAIAVTVAWYSGVNISFLVESAEIRRGQLWRLLTAIFPHLGILHLVFNLYWLWILGTVVERVFGHTKTILLFVLFAIGYNSLDFAFDRGGVGLSGVGYALVGLLWVLSARDERFKGAIDKRTIDLFIGWFFICIVTTLTHIFVVANVAHPAGAVLGVLVGFAIADPARRLAYGASTLMLVLFGLWGCTLGRPVVNLSGKVGYEEAKWGYDALQDGRNEDTIRWLKDAVKLQPKSATNCFNLGIAYQRAAELPPAIAAYGRAHELDPQNPKYTEAARQ